MSTITLRSYLNEINALIEQGQLDEAIGHCRHILKRYPKHLESYRLLGKAYLEAKRYTDAADVFQRVLTAVPDDFISHLGMSIIREDEGNLDAAIWHMERAFEVRPSNVAIQGELRRLYGHRDGVEPPKIRLTRGALARMYLQGNLHQQAIAELRAALASDPERPDLQVLLARAYHAAGMKVEAAEVCAGLLKRLPYCLEANRIMSDVLKGTDRDEDARTYRRRMIALDPYLAFVDENTPTLEQVPDQAVTIERLEWHPDMATETQAQPLGWTEALGVEIEDEEEAPEWLSSLDASADATSEPSAAGETSPEDLIPDFMKEAGWTPREGPLEEEPTDFFADEEPLAPSEEVIEPGEIPDWMKELAPPEALSEEEGETAPEPPIWVEEEGGASETIATWLEGVEGDEVPEASEAPEVSEEAEVPDWLAGLGEEAKETEVPEVSEAPEVSEEAEVPDWLAGLGEETKETEVPEDSKAPEVSEEAEVPDWLAGLGTEETPEAASASEEAEVPDWLASLGKETKGTEVSEVSEVPEAFEEAEVPDWLAEPGEPETAETAEATEVPETPEMPETPPIAEVAETPEAAEMPSDLSDTDAALAWLESLAAKQGAKEEELLTRPEERIETPPEWVAEEATAGEAEAAETMETSGAEPTETAEATEVPDWLSELGETEEPEATDDSEVATVAEASEEPEVPEVPEWLSALSEPEVSEGTAIAEATEEEPQPTPSAQQPEEPAVAEPSDLSDTDAALAWLESLAAKQGAKEEELLTRPEERIETPPEWVAEAAEAEGIAEAAVPDEAEGTEATEAAEILEEPEIPEWLTNLKSEEVLEAAGEAKAAESVPEWLAGLTSEGETEPVAEEAAGTEPAMETPEAEEELPAWLSEPKPEEAAEPKVERPATEEAPAIPLAEMPTVPSPTAPEAMEEELPAWLSEEAPGTPLTSEEAEAKTVEEGLPAWLNEESTPEAGTLAEEPEGVTEVAAEEATEWVPEEAIAPKAEAEPEEEVYAWQPPAVEAEVTAEPAEEAPPPPPTTKADRYAIWLAQARTALEQGDLETALEQYNRLIKKSRFLEDIIADIQNALYRHPVDVQLWQALGDAFMRADRLQDALDAYTKAEELLR